MNEHNVKILGIESSCDDTSAAVLNGKIMLSNIVAGQEVHKEYGGVVPELASRAHLQNIVPVVEMALKKAGVKKEEINAIALTRGPGLMGSLLVGVSYAKALAMALNIPLIEVNHMQAHVLAHFIQLTGIEDAKSPTFPFLCLTVSGGHTQIVKVNDYLDMEVIGQTTDDAAGEAFDKAAKIMGLPYPGGPLVDKYAAHGDSTKYSFPIPNVPALDFSFSGIKTAFRNKWSVISDQKSEIIIADLCASFQLCIITILLNKLIQASKQTGINEIAIAGGVSANSGLRNALQEQAKRNNWNIYIPPFQFCTDNAAMIAITGYFKYLKKDFAKPDITPLARYAI